MGRKTRTATASAVTGSSVVPSLWHAAIYVRLSVLDNGKPDGESLESQIRFLEQYTEAHSELSLIELYQDNGFTGTNFSRPGWEALMADAYAGRINCIVVKDLSRVGRNYIEVGAFLERDCPRLGIRLISVNDGYDSTSQNATEEAGSRCHWKASSPFRPGALSKNCPRMKSSRGSNTWMDIGARP